jgi:hypothetical protein
LHPLAKLGENGPHPETAKQGILLEGIEEPIRVAAFGLSSVTTRASSEQTSQSNAPSLEIGACRKSSFGFGLYHAIFRFLHQLLRIAASKTTALIP